MNNIMKGALFQVALTLFLLSGSACGGQEDASPLPAVFLKDAFPELRFERPIFLTDCGDKSGRIFVAEQAGRILVFDKKAQKTSVFLDIRSKVRQKHTHWARRRERSCGIVPATASTSCDSMQTKG